MKVTVIFIAVAIAAFALEVAGDSEAIFTTYGFSGQNMAERPHVLVTSIFLHGSLEHLLANILIWLFFGMAVEKELGALRMSVIFLLGAFAGDLMSLAFYPWDSLAIGASAGIFALVGAGMLVRPLDLSLYPLVIPVPLALLGMFYAIYNAYEFVFAPAANISYVGHFGGLFVGLVAGFRHKGVKEGTRIILITIAVMVLIPLILMAALGRI
jgi:membrane associated rhomboid family serine protease